MSDRGLKIVLAVAVTCLIVSAFLAILAAVHVITSQLLAIICIGLAVAGMAIFLLLTLWFIWQWAFEP